MTQHHPTTPARLASTQPMAISRGPSFKDLPTRTRSPLRVTNQKPTALFSKKAGALPIRLFSWSAASLATIAALSSYGTPAFGHHFKYRDLISNNPEYSFRNHPLRDSIVPICTPEEIRRGETLVALTQGVVIYALEIIEDDGHFIYERHCHEGENELPIVRGDIGGPLGQNLDVVNNPTASFDLGRYFSDPDEDELSYTVTSSDPSSVRAAVRDGTLTVGAVGEGTAIITVTASDGKGGTVSTDFLVRVTNETVVDGSRGGYAKEVLKQVAKETANQVTPPLVGTIIGAVFGGPAGAGVGAAIGKGVGNLKTAWDVGRIVGDGVNTLINSNDGIDSGEGFSRLAETLYIHQEALQNGSISLDQAFSGQRFSLPFSLSQASAEDQDSSPRRFNALFTGGVDFTSFSDSTPGLDFDGSTTAYGLGVTAFPNPDVPLLTGLHLGFTRSNSDFEDTEEDVKGAYKLEMFSVHPSIAWDATDNLTLWAALGYGRPNTETTIDSIAGSDVDSAQDASSSSGDFFSVAGGANYRVWQSDASALSINLSGSTASMLDTDFQQGRIAAQFSHDFPLNSGQLNSSADLALLLSNSNPSTAELSGQLNWLPTQGRLSGSTNARVLLFGGDRSEWGIGGSLLLLPGERGEGLSLALQPSFGQTNASLSSLHLDPFSFSDPTELALSSSPLTARFNAELAYGFPTANHALLTPYIDAHLAHNANTYTTGLRYQLDSGLNLDLSASHRQRSSGNNDNRLFLQLRSDL